MAIEGFEGFRGLKRMSERNRHYRDLFDNNRCLACEGSGKYVCRIKIKQDSKKDFETELCLVCKGTGKYTNRK